MCNFLNSLTAPIGVRLTPGGPYPDAGLGDKAMQASQPLQAAGQNLIQQGQTALPNLFSQYAGTAGINDPLTGQPGKTSGQGPYKLSPTHLMNYNNQAGVINAARKQAISNLQNNYGGRGLGASKGQMKALIQQVNNAADTHLNDVYNQIVQAAHNEQLQALSNLFGQANTMTSQGGNLISGNVGTLQNQAQAATQRTNQAAAAGGSALGAALGGLIPIPKASTAPSTYIPAASAGAIGGPTGAIFDNYGEQPWMQPYKTGGVWVYPQGNPNPPSALGYPDLTSGAY